MSAGAPSSQRRWLAEPTPEAAAVEDLFVTRTVEFAFHRTRTWFELARTVFSSADVDPGSALLLRHLQSLPLGDVATVLDVGCGHGTLGIVLKALDPDRRVTFVDRDALACRFTARNLRLNALSPGCEVIGSLGYDQLAGYQPASGESATARSTAEPVPADGLATDEGAIGALGPDTWRAGDRPFDLVVSNLPGKVGTAVMTELVEGAARVAGRGALLGFVVVVPLADQLRMLLQPPTFEAILDKGNKTHNVVIVEVGERPRPVRPEGGFEHGCYDRSRSTFRSADVSWSARTVVGLDEFDRLAQPTKLLRQALQGVRSTRTTIVNPGQGHRAVIAALAGYRPDVLISRDLLSLRASARCLADAGIRYPPELVHDVTGAGYYGQAGLTILHADDKVHGPWLSAEVERYLEELSDPVTSTDGGLSVANDQSPECQLVVTGRSGLLGRLEADLLNRRRGHVAYKNSVRGHRVLRYVVR
ncbi:MAG: class I SAM-dependent methyltransferase [Acidimicrobiia bacterium]|nr:class I SAM-dependent methyltransferase [Acidimicrobiia bacterium]